MYEIIGKNGFVPTEAIKEYAIKRLTKVKSLFNEDAINRIRVVTKVYSNHHKVEVTIYASGQVIRAEVSDEDMYVAIDKSTDKLVAQIRRHRDKLKANFEKEGIADGFSSEFDAESLEKELVASQLVKNKVVELTPMTLDEAITEMELQGYDFYIFLDKETDKTNVVYQRMDGDYAVLETKID
ncbi:MAG TPA: ribosome-associated translation inhibitor RaiA [Acholeplasmataceae bacterium]|nr:ribosome-associated translation inhibitor RaiA [Acholeplasmataceae bacterium]